MAFPIQELFELFSSPTCLGFIDIWADLSVGLCLPGGDIYILIVFNCSACPSLDQAIPSSVSFGTSLILVAQPPAVNCCDGLISYLTRVSESELTPTLAEPRGYFQRLEHICECIFMTFRAPGNLNGFLPQHTVAITQLFWLLRKWISVIVISN